MKIKILAFGKIGRCTEQDLIDDYLRRLPWPCEIVEYEIKKPAKTAELRKAQEAEKLLKAIPPGAAIIALDERGKALSSRQFSGTLMNWINEGINTVVFIIGGADGLDETVRRKAKLTLGFGSLTWPHKLARVMLAEQLYRAWSISTGHPYHRD
jgi:23S rRNA (pseudouridine1915-N3)-methyltransferase